ncbi:hypothetical protein RHECNPAF_780016 [Rhizobium etli CNPAF512]|nr:hypothetical protein RHECNPAF_780016 [Rhizobium etli CNPAF512]
MDFSIHFAALRRYSALTGTLDDLTAGERIQAESDRAEYGGEYIPCRECGFDKSALLLRFMHEICHIPLWQAREVTVVVVRQNEAFCVRGMTPEETAGLIVRDTGNVLIAEIIAALYESAAEGTEWKEFWRNVVRVLWYAEPASDMGAGDQNSTLH